ncbi:MAG: nucleotidyl transferase AbiEii/AbiGii toxin family protein, partial [Raoultibacter sp.]
MRKETGMMGSFTQSLDSLKPKEKEPNSVATLSKWIDMAERQLGNEKSGRLAWLVATTVVIAKLQQVVDAQGAACFVLKGGTLLQYRLGLNARATKDIDGIVRCDIDDFIRNLDILMREPWGSIKFSRSEVEEIRVPSKLINPRRFDISLLLRGKTWRRIQVEISPDEGAAGKTVEDFSSPSLAGFGLPTPDVMVGLAMSYQIAQKIHAASDPCDPPEYVNDRARDVVDLILLKQMVEEAGRPDKETLS